MRCDEWNAAPRIVIEHNEKMLNNQLAEDGTCLTSSANIQFDNLFENALEDSTDARAKVIKKQANEARLPKNTHLFALPKNHSIRGMDPVQYPNSMPEAEIDYQRAVCYCMGVPCNLVMQFYQAGTSSTQSGTTNDATSHSTQMLQNTCTHVASSLCKLLQEVYEKSFMLDDTETSEPTLQNSANAAKKKRGVVFHINCTPTMTLADITELHFRQLVKDEAINEMLLSSIGFPLNQSANRLPWNKTVQEPTPPEVLKAKAQKTK